MAGMLPKPTARLVHTCGLVENGCICRCGMLLEGVSFFYT